MPREVASAIELVLPAWLQFHLTSTTIASTLVHRKTFIAKTVSKTLRSKTWSLPLLQHERGRSRLHC
jgi:hypothetical protein